jgi:hypothetical protein
VVVMVMVMVMTMMMKMMMMIIYIIPGLRSVTLALRGDFLYVTYTTDFPLGGPHYRVMRTAPPPRIVRMTEGQL